MPPVRAPGILQGGGGGACARSQTWPRSVLAQLWTLTGRSCPTQTPGNAAQPLRPFSSHWVSGCPNGFVFLFLKIMGNSSEFQKAVKLVINTVSFDKDSTVQVFEATIR